jgi:uncharacterized protein (TIGR00255 family)
MTGYANGQKAAPETTGEGASWKIAQTRLAVELRSVNSRFLDLAFRLPDELRQHEPALRALLSQKLKRGKVELRVAVDGRDGASLVNPSARVLQRLSALQDQVRVWMPDAASLSTADALRLAANSESAAEAGLGDELMPLVERVLSDLMSARAREGDRLVQLLREHVKQLHRLANAVEPLVPQAVEAQKQRFLSRWADAIGGAEGGVALEAAQDRALAEATAFAIRVDVAEELGRLKSHLDEIEGVLTKGGEVGKRLDFLIQELHREANTLGSKSPTLELTRLSVDMKVLIEQMREQVQNLE